MYKTISVSGEPSNTVLSNANMVNYGQLSPLPYGVNNSYETVRYLVPVQQPAQQQSYVLVNNAPQQQVMQQMVYLQNVPRASVSSTEDSEYTYRQQVITEVSCLQAPGRLNSRHRFLSTNRLLPMTILLV